MQVGPLDVTSLLSAFDSLQISDRDSTEQVREFQENHAREISLLTQATWKELKQEKGPELERFRTVANAFINRLTCEYAKELKLDAATFSDCGTVGYDSDVDFTVQIASKNIEHAVLYKKLRDRIHTIVLGGSSGRQLDTETYIPHPAEFNIGAHLQSEEAKGYFQTAEKLSVLLQRVVSLKDFPNTYNKSVERDLNGIEDPVEKEAMRALIAHAEELVCLSPMLDSVQLGKRASEIQRRIAHAYQNMQFADIDQRLEIEKELDRLHLELQSSLILLAMLQNEGTISSSEGMVTILKMGGQLDLRAKKKRANSFGAVLDANMETHKALAKQDPRYGRKVSDPLAGSARRSRELLTTYLRNDFSTMFMPPFESATALTFFTASQEEEAQVEHIIEQGFFEGKKPQEVVVNAAKYLLRVTQNLRRGLSEIAPKDPLALQVKVLHEKCEHLEKCKRQATLSTIGAKELLTERIFKRAGHQGAYDAHKIELDIHNLLSPFDYGRIYQKDPPPQSVHMDHLERGLLGMKNLNYREVPPKIQTIFQAHAGFDRLKDPKIQELHNRSQEITVRKLGLTQEPAVRAFVAEILDVGQKVRNLARRFGVIPISTPSMVEFIRKGVKI